MKTVNIRLTVVNSKIMTLQKRITKIKHKYDMIIKTI